MLARVFKTVRARGTCLACCVKSTCDQQRSRAAVRPSVYIDITVTIPAILHAPRALLPALIHALLHIPRALLPARARSFFTHFSTQFSTHFSTHHALSSPQLPPAARRAQSLIPHFSTHVHHAHAHSSPSPHFVDRSMPMPMPMPMHALPDRVQF